MEHPQIGTRQFTVLVIMFIVGSSILMIPGAIAMHAKQDSWISSILAVAAGLGLIVLYCAIGSKFPGKTLFEYCKILLGKWIGLFVAIQFFIFSYLLAAFMLRYIGDFLTTEVMPETPITAILILFMVIVIMAASLGLEVLTRAAEIFFPWIVLFYFIIAVFVSPQIQMINLQPMLEHGLKPVLQGSLPLISIPYLELSLFLFIFPNVKNLNKRRQAFLIGGIIGGFLIVVVTFLSITVLGASLTIRNNYPTFSLTQKIHVGNFLQRVESLLAVIWFLTIFFKSAVTYYVSALGLAQILNLKDYRTVLVPLGVILVPLSLIVYPDIIYGNKFSGLVWTPYASMYGIVLPVLLLIVAFLRRKKLAPPPDSDSGSGSNSDSNSDSNSNSNLTDTSPNDSDNQEKLLKRLF
ncbi:GerAB/ArcD/ProY family transporter [Paenibacillus eucommiae]|uniref:Spore germination protein KB n=1 Tax=Paenibacillus eucommiae TaxID=1355755 RepID=A0ABS4IXW0_9BACL|nr:endospore germination permease [Paenibacillus eucommiae]MBP1992422.1 spore germination protein KB [Paenibacillus eucommiae]